MSWTHVRRENKRTGDLDGLTGLQNQTALARRIESGGEFPGVVAVCDMDNFKEINDRFGHLVGDEILRNIGNLLHASIRHEDEAFRWGGDEFVILFLNQLPEVAGKAHGGAGSPAAGVPRARFRDAADVGELGNRGCAGPSATGCPG